MARAARSLARDELIGLGWLSYSPTLEKSVFVILGDSRVSVCACACARADRAACGLPRYPEKCTHRYCTETKATFGPTILLRCSSSSTAECTELLLPNNRFLIPSRKSSAQHAPLVFAATTDSNYFSVTPVSIHVVFVSLTETFRESLD